VLEETGWDVAERVRHKASWVQDDGVSAGGVENDFGGVRREVGTEQIAKGERRRTVPADGHGVTEDVCDT
jgi:hypothetical protein